MAQIIMRGSEVSGAMKEALIKDAAFLKPVLAIVRVGSRPDDLSYERGIIKRFDSLGLTVKVHELPENISQPEFDSEFAKVNSDSENHGVLLFRPLPKTLSDDYAVSTVNPRKDIDCMSHKNLAGVFAGDKDSFAPCTPLAVMEMLRFYGINLSGKNIVIIGRSLVLGRPLAMLMLGENATVTICHTRTQNLPEVCRRADVIVAAAGKARMVTPEFVNEKSIIVDVGINVDSEGKLCGDVDFERVSPLVHA
ncbi:MAG: bifunctional 5,10-methylenetetrahydrofolate dehydrogenase/5,10-methenyltetrahydrofolate cyclohydrolase, partial [Synergistaceae bacterium]|nr:bifunctional 5,10-methylenetetrahydrofolate dehydrogenase/5,10-methenyltetrahydrofolate cyclohydrolase [Synergistaceae bacterium]